MLPGGAAERAVIAAALVLVARKLADFTEGSVVEVVAVAIEAIFGKIFVIFDAVFGAEFFSLGPSFGLNFEELDVRMIVVLAQEVVPEFVEE